MKAINEAGYTPGKDVNFAIDVAASEFYEDGVYNLKGANLKLTTDELINYYQTLLEKYPNAVVLTNPKVAENIKDIILNYNSLSVQQRQQLRRSAANIVKNAEWENFVENYFKAFAFAITKTKERNSK